MKDDSQQTINITVNLDNVSHKIEVKQEENSDGAAYYYCELNGKRITQIRKDDKNQWHQLWGNLDDISITAIGEAIDQHSGFIN